MGMEVLIMTLNQYMEIQKRSHLVTNGIMAFLGTTFATLIALTLFLNQQPANAISGDTAKEDNYALYAAAYTKGYTASALAASGAGSSSTAAVGCHESDSETTDEAKGATSSPMSKQAWSATVQNSYNSYASNSVSYVKNVDSNNTTTTNNSSASTVNVTNSDGAAVSTNNATNGQINSNTQVKNEDSNNTKTTTTTGSFNSDSHDIKTTTTNVTNNVAIHSFNDEIVKDDEPNHDNPPHHNDY